MTINYAENRIQQTLYAWFCLKYPQYEDLFSASLAGVCTNAKTGARLKASGATRGWPDINIAVVTKKYPGLYIELKTETGDLRSWQADILDKLSSQGYRAVCCYGLDEAIREVESYCKI